MFLSFKPNKIYPQSITLLFLIFWSFNFFPIANYMPIQGKAMM
jgi:hypothetical protein